MQRVVINACFGGFSLSHDGERAYLERQGKQAFFYTDDRNSAPRPSDRDLVRIDDLDPSSYLLTYTSTRDFGIRVDHATFWGDGNKTPEWYFNDRDLKRDDPDLVAVVEDLGHKADGTHANLEVVEIPDDVQWQIEEYDGLEHVAEAHRTWS